MRGELYTQGWQNTGGLEAKYSQAKVNSILEATAAQDSSGQEGKAPQKAGGASGAAQPFLLVFCSIKTK